VPVPGWSGDYDWIGRIPFDDLPHVVDPPRGYIATANEKIVDDDYPYFLGADWQPGFRSNRIRDLLEARDDHDWTSFAAIQADTRSLMARHFLASAADADPQSELGRTMKSMLDGWQGDMAAEAPQPLIFAAWYRELTRAIYADDLGENFADAWWHRPTFTHAVMSGALDAWCDDVTTEPVETCAELAGLAFDRAADFLAARYGDDPAAWQWGRSHMATFNHRLFGYLPILSDLTVLRLPVGGDRYTVNTGAYIFNSDDAVFTDIHGASMRAVFDLADLDASRFVWAPGQSGHVFSPYYDDMLTRWRDNDMVTIPSSRDLIDPAHTLILEPSNDG
jgi:penicillin amidase